MTLHHQQEEAADLARCGVSSTRLTSATEMAAWDALLFFWAPHDCSTRESIRGSSIGLKQLPTASVMLGCRRASCNTVTRAGSGLATCTDRIPSHMSGVLECCVHSTNLRYNACVLLHLPYVVSGPFEAMLKGQAALAYAESDGSHASPNLTGICQTS